jgi:hypothetical protein
LGSFGNFHGFGLGGNVHRQRGGDGRWKMAKAANRFVIFVLQSVRVAQFREDFPDAVYSLFPYCVHSFDVRSSMFDVRCFCSPAICHLPSAIFHLLWLWLRRAVFSAVKKDFVSRLLLCFYVYLRSSALICG